MSNATFVNDAAMKAQMQPCYGPITPTRHNTTTLSSGLTNSASERPLSESSTASYPHITGVVAEFWAWLEDAGNSEWAVLAFPVEKGYSDRNIFVTKLPPTFNDRDLQSMFANFGNVVSAKVMLNVSTGASKETGFVQFATARDALRARCFLRLRPTVTEPAMPEVGTQWAQNKHDGGVYGDRSRLARKLFLRNIPASVTNEEMRALVTAFGDVAEVTLHADTYDAAAAAATATTTTAARATRATDSSEEEEGSTDASAAAPPTSPQRTMRICFVTFLQPGVAARACAALHNTKPFPACHDIPVMAKIAEDNNARQARHQQGAMYRADLRAAAAALQHPRSPMSGSDHRNGSLSPATPSAWYPSMNMTDPMGCNGMANMMSGHQSGYSQDAPHGGFYVSPRQAHSGNWCATSPSAPSMGYGAAAMPTNAAAAAAPAGFSRLTFQPQNPHAVAAMDPSTHASSVTPRALSNTASPTMKMPAAPSFDGGHATSHRPSRLALTMASSSSSGKARIPATITSAPTSARRTPRDLGRSSTSSFAADATHATSSVFSAAASVSGVYAAESLSSPSIAALHQHLQRHTPLSTGVSRKASSASAATPHAAATAGSALVSPRAQVVSNGLSPRSSDTATSHESNALDNGMRHHVTVHVSPSRQRRMAQKTHSPTTASTSQTSPYASAQAAKAAMLPVPTMTVAALSVGPSSMSRNGWDSVEESNGSPFVSPLSASRNTSSLTPTHMGCGSQTRYRNNPYGMNIVVERTRSTSIAEA